MARQPGQPHSMLVIERILRDRDGIWEQIIAERDLGALVKQMTLSSAISLAIYGAVLGASNSWAQAISSFVKLPLLFLATLAICLPTLYLFNLVFGARLTVMQAVTLIMVCITVTATLTLAFAPISLFFLISAHNYQFFKLLNVAILVLTAFVGLRFLTRGMRALNDHQELLARAALPVPVSPAPAPEPVAVAVAVPAGAPTNGAAEVSQIVPAAAGQLAPLPVRIPAPVPAQRPASMTLLYIWILLFGFVGTQLAWTLRPFFGDPGRPFALFRHIEGTFYADIFRSIGHLFGG